ncbi:hypothetical protein K493DRAFT_315135 [Basidiobolus meristosporus CBS 931.73]|uniref:Trichothecene 3-O-acetyltransferase-like N-terminal domain-containing protein n=1 Tax=Basidiobolus meristosporus CBS 931.73 TaxID=1314790 RepID=A0A1Y1YBQ4_9FUNG|nr:hypothetical protein K493DRAFT_315135 [Basidiobolus meristosporus CBS 931.73]|eukprot:ORX95196.1 hypothetical protein K493DRAFT_315135 [Basidiobolus meristosporus CBS 931.73]
MYTNLSYIFALDDSPNQSATDSVVQSLTNGLQRLSESFPWIAGQVGSTGADQGGSTAFKIIPFESMPPLQTAHRPDLSIKTFIESNWSMQMLDPDVFAPRLSPLGQAPKPSDPAPVFLLRATFITGAVVLTFAANHSAMDMTGQTMMIRLLSRACHSIQFTEEELRLGNREIGCKIALFEDRGDQELKAEIASQLSRKTAETEIPKVNDPQEPAKLTWAYFQADMSSLAAIKAKATESNPSSSFVSTDDALTALIWQAISRARRSRLGVSTRLLLARAVDVRKSMGISERYPGMMQNMAFNNLTIEEVLEMPLGAVAAQLRNKLDPNNLGHAMRVIMTLMSRHPHESPILPYLKPSHDVMITSWAKMDCYSDDFDLGLGKPEIVLRPRLPPVGEGWVNLMPKSEKRGIIFGVCLREADMMLFKADEQLRECVDCIA